MTEVDGDLIYEILKNLQARATNVELVLIEHSKELQALRGHSASAQTDMTNIYGVLQRIDSRLDRIERRLELRELAEAQKQFDPNS
jgi:hypothetical protein